MFLGKFLTTEVGEERCLQVFTRENPFIIHWDVLYKVIDKALVADGFDRLKDWAVQTVSDPTRAEFQRPTKREASEELELPGWFQSVAVTDPTAKKLKKEEVCPPTSYSLHR